MFDGDIPFPVAAKEFHLTAVLNLVDIIDAILGDDGTGTDIGAGRITLSPVDIDCIKEFGELDVRRTGRTHRADQFRQGRVVGK